MTARQARAQAGIRIAACIASSLFFMGVAISRLRFEEIRTALSNARTLPWVPLAVLSYLVGHVIRGVRCKMLVSRTATLSLPAATNVVVLGYAVNNILPARLGGSRTCHKALASDRHAVRAKHIRHAARAPT